MSLRDEIAEAADSAYRNTPPFGDYAYAAADAVLNLLRRSGNKEWGTDEETFVVPPGLEGQWLEVYLPEGEWIVINVQDK